MTKKDEVDAQKKDQDQNEEYLEESSCGIGSFHPGPLQCCKTVLVFSFFFGLVNTATQSLSVYINSQVTALEKQFDLSSSTTGIILSANDIGFLATVLLFGHFGKNGHIPKIFAVTAFLFGISGIMASMCYFLDPYYLPKLSVDGIQNSTRSNVFVAPLCKPDAESQVDKCIQDENNPATSGGSSWQVWLLCISMVLQGIAKAPRTPLAITYIDNNNVDKSKTALHLGITMAMTIFGPALSTVLGGVFRGIPIDLQETDLTPKHPKWIGAWWLGFIVFGCLALIVAIPLLFFPRHILPLQKKKKEDVDHQSALDAIKDLPRSVMRVFKRPVYTLLLCGVLVKVFTISGKQAFSSKYVEYQFMTPGSTTNIMMGIRSLVSATFGTMIGAVLTSRLKLTRLGCLKLAMMSAGVLVVTIILQFVLGCETPYIHGLHDRPAPDVDDCYCSSVDYFPVCAEDGSNYFSPCYAGCTNQTNTVIGGCSEIASGQVNAGLCETDCPYLYYYIAADVVQLVGGTVNILPLSIALIRSVEDRDKALATGISAFLSSLLAYIPAPIIYGYIIDTACIVWNTQCGVTGACLQYDLYDLRIKLQSSLLVGLALFCLFLLAAIVVLRRQGGAEEKAEELGRKRPAQQEPEMVKYMENEKTEATHL